MYGHINHTCIGSNAKQEHTLHVYARKYYHKNET